MNLNFTKGEIDVYERNTYKWLTLNYVVNYVPNLSCLYLRITQNKT